MSWLRVLVSRFNGLLRKDGGEREMNEEMRAHLEMQAEENLRKGMTAEEARRAALRSFGGVEQAKEAYRDQRSLPFIETLIQDVRYGLRMLRKNPGFTAVAVITLALGIGANTAIFSLVNAVLLRPLPYPQSGRLVWITEFIPALKAEVTGGGDYVDWKNQNKSFEQISGYDDSANFNLTGRGTPERIHGARVSAGIFTVLRVQPQLGRSFTSEEDQPNGRKAAILMHGFWQQYFGSDPHVLGQTILLDAAPYTVIGVMPASFKWPGQPDLQLLVPLQLNEASELLRGRQTLLHVFGRLRPGISAARARNDLDAIRKRALAAALVPASGITSARNGPASAPPSGAGPPTMMRFQTQNGPPPPGAQMAPGAAGGKSPSSPGQFSPQANPPAGRMVGQTSAGAPPQSFARGPSPQGIPNPSHGHVGWTGPNGPPETEVRVIPLAEHLAGNLRPAMLTMLGVVGLILLIASANVASLMLARASSRTREVALRAALGAGRWRLVRQLLSESVVLALCGGAAGLLLAAWGVNVMTGLIPPSIGGEILSLARPHMDPTVLLFALGVSVLTGIVFGIAPAFSVTRPGLVERLNESSQSATAGVTRGWLRSGLAVAELSLALVVLIAAGLLMKSFYRLLSVNLGFAPEHVLTMTINLTDLRYPQSEEKLQFFSDVLRRVESLPGVKSAALGDSLPLSPYHMRLMMLREMVAKPGSTPGSNVVQMSRLSVSPSYFYTLGIPLREGRTFTDRDDEQSPRVAVINEGLARLLWPGENPIGRNLPSFGGSIKVIGVVGDTHHDGPGENVQSEIYVPYLQAPMGTMQLAIRTAEEASSLAGAARKQVVAVDPEQPIYNMITLEQALSESVAPKRFYAVLLGIFAGLALALSTVGIYGVIAYSVAQRTREIGIRVALGAARQDVLRLVVGEGLKLTLIGMTLGVAGALVLTRFLSSFLFGVKPTDPLTFAAVSVLLVAVALLACYIPARRAMKVDPMVALRYE